jgi:hypothetical protein
MKLCSEYRRLWWGFLAQTAKNMQYDFVGFSASPARTVVIIANS